MLQWKTFKVWTEGSQGPTKVFEGEFAIQAAEQYAEKYGAALVKVQDSRFGGTPMRFAPNGFGQMELEG